MSTSEPMPETTSEPEEPRLRRPGLVLAFLSTAGFMTFLDVSIVNVAPPTIEDEIHVPSTHLPHIVTTYGMVLGGFLLLCGRPATRSAAVSCSRPACRSSPWPPPPRHSP
ncbi:hypothetical protein NOSIN_24165 [Nocardiopsis sinuspersici]|uniref:Major facilitator superfamily (MFS) profile domain-containing protein n=1 Tax=Nocardiopsis sinuspersici TaxID=501010 RepID=A0A1V3C7C6_9ACTN|nr:hypothetical protein NOSIN_24165 [Nocardiopsis sinuspersici]